ncbi:FGGY-family carbohydrate kinase [Psychromarinibacter halotolerans]|uniref:FGGY-family carbohydrate kinase n=1 Tax=Psychromarinibacter halotolerans TaxID=1775175 RepID=A0ABV7GRW2_9RHOB|nr:FGGY-family carbohydrate kinase [Psychromarinibacter halotolerans]MDF0596822.1 FGGY-family carbohydrate kinase [Psychromarinibacter halotolerans]
MSNVAVIDIGKTNAKLAVVDTVQMHEVGVLTRPNAVRPGAPYPHYDIEGHWAFLLDALATLHAEHGIDAISVTAHGASIVLLDADGGLACPMLDYENDGPDALADAYDAIRPAFADTGSPRLPMGLNVGAQLHWLLETQVGLRDRLAQVVTYPQFWSGRLTGNFACEYTSLGCHTDLWLPREGRYSALVETLGLTDKMAPLAKAGDVAGALLPDIATRTGLPADTPVFSGIHDSNASLLPHLIATQAPFSVVSTGTWVISMAVGGPTVPLDAARDTLMNVNANGGATPSARFMGGREYELAKPETAPPTPADVDAVLNGKLFLLPSVEPGSGPFQHRTGGWSDPAMTPGQKGAALSFYLALMTATCLDLIGAGGPTIVEGPFARNPQFHDMLGAATGRAVSTAASATGTSIGAALLARPDAPVPALTVTKAPTGDRWRAYATAWAQAVARTPEPATSS